MASGRDNAFNGMANQRVDQVSDDVYGPKTGLPNTNVASGTLRRISSMTGDPRIMQFGIKYGFQE